MNLKEKDLIRLIHIFNVGKFTNVLTILKLCQYLRTNFFKKSFFFFYQKMLNIILKEIPLKFTKNDFRQENTPDLLIDFWTCNYYKPHSENCNACKIFCEWCVEILEERWKEEWGDMKNAIEKLKKKL